MKKSIASAPGKLILFGEHAVVYKKPAISIAVDIRAKITITPSKSKTIFACDDLNIKSVMDFEKKEFHMLSGQEGIVEYIFEVLKLKHDYLNPINIDLALDLPIGAGLGSSAAITVALIAALDNYYNKELNLDEIAKTAHNVELNVQGSASPLDTATSAYGGLIFLDENSKVTKLSASFGDIIIGYASQRGNTRQMVAKVKKLKEHYPVLINSLLDAIGNITLQAKEIFDKEKLTKNDFQVIADLLNINQGLLDAIGVNTLELSNMIYTSRKTGAIGSKLTGAGGGGSIIALCPGKRKEVLKELQITENALEANFSKNGVIIHN